MSDSPRLVLPRSPLLWPRRSVLGSIATLGLGACRSGARTRAPYSTPPSPQTLYEALTPRVRELAILEAQIKDEMLPGVAFAAAIQYPSRIHASISLKGQELMSLVANEEGYGLRYNYDRGIAPGYYHGPKNNCAVQRFLGAPIEVDDLIALLLGGGPGSFRADSVLEQSWDRKLGAERVVFFDQQKRRSLVAHFVLHQDQWLLQQGAGYRYQNNRPRWEWSLAHQDLQGLPEIPALGARIEIGRLQNNGRRYLELQIRKATTKVNFADTAAQSEGDDFGDDEDWEEADGSQDPSAPKAPVQTPSASQKAPASTIPSVFVPNPAGLVDRGPLCEGP